MAVSPAALFSRASSFPDTAFVLVGRCLAPRLNGTRTQALAKALARPAVRWEALLAEANRHRITPLWYARLRRHGFLTLLPENLADYLGRLYDANADRNRMLQDELGGILALFQENGIPTVLLKGAATFADRLYPGQGDRLMSDLDLLVPEARLAEAERLLMMEGYVDDPRDRRHLDRWPASARHSHIAVLQHLRRNVAVELHYRPAYGMAGRILTAEAVNREAVSGTFRDRRAAWPAPRHRLLHNALHAALPNREFWLARLRLADMAEFTELLYRYPEAIDAAAFWQAVRQPGVASAIGTYAALAQVLMGSPLVPPAFPRSTWHQRRLAGASPPAAHDAGPLARLRDPAWQTVSVIYTMAGLPRWTWQNVCYGDDATPAAARLGCLARLLKRPGMVFKMLGF